MQTIILILRAIDKKRPLVIKGHPSIPAAYFFLLTLILDFLLLEISHQFFKVFFADVAEQEVIERLDVSIGAISDNVDCCLRAE